MIVRIAWRNIVGKPLSTLLSWVLLSVSVGIISMLLLLQDQLQTQFDNSSKGIDMVIGAKGSPLQLILSSVYHIDDPTGNIKLKEAERWMNDPFVESAIPLAYGDSYKGYSIVGTTPGYVQKYGSAIGTGKMFAGDFEVVAGNELANKLQLKVGSRFYSTHGDEHGEQHKEKVYTVTGILKPSGTVLDNLLLSNIESVWKIHEHEDPEHTESLQEADSLDADHEKEITAVLIKFRNPMGYIQLPRLINEQSHLMAAIPSIEVNRLLSLFAVAIAMLKKIGWGIMFLSALSIFIALFNSLKERKYELALMRTMGAGRTRLLVLLLLEALILVSCGLVSGLLFSRLGLFVVARSLAKDYHITIENWAVQWPQEFWLIVAVLLLGIAGAVVPAIKAWSINISKTMSDG